MDKSILEAVHESAKDLHYDEVRDKVIMREFDKICMKTKRAVLRLIQSVTIKVQKN